MHNLKYVLTKHALQRRDHHPIREKEFVLRWVKYFDNKFNYNNLENGVYKIKKRKYMYIFRKTDRKVIVITLVNFDDDLWEQKDDMGFYINNTKYEERSKIWRTNFVDRSVKCGGISYNKDGSVRIKFMRSMYSKFIMPDELQNIPMKGIKFDSIDDVYFIDEIDGRNFFNLQLERKE